MARVTVEDCIDKVDSPYELVLVAKERATQLNSGMEPTLDRDNDKNTVVSVREIAEQVQEIVPNSEVEFANESNKDFRSYRVDFDKIAKVLNFKTKWNLKDGIKQLYDVFIKEKFSESDFRNKKFHRIDQLKWLIEEGHLDEHFKIN